MNPIIRWRLLVTTFTVSFLGLLGFIFLFTAAPRSQAQPSAVTFKNQDGVPITGEVRVLCFATADAAAPLADRLVPVVAGAPTMPLPANCSYLAALRLRHTQPAGKYDEPAYQIFATSWQPGAATPLLAGGDIVLNDSWPLTLFTVVASLGWEPAPNSAVTTVGDVRESLYQTAQELYDWTDGQMLLGPISVHTGGDRWAEADLRFVPANDKRPSAFVGGIVPDTLAYTGFLTNTTYTPAMIYLGRLWDGRDGFVEGNGRWTTPNAYRTIAHEWAHYGLFLYDAYQDTTGSSGSCICETLSAAGCGFGDRDASAMAYHYRATEFWHKDTHLTVANFCYDTWQFHVHGQTDWETLLQWPAIQGLSLPLQPLRSPTTSLNAGPALGLARHLIGQSPGSESFLPLVTGGSGTAVLPQEPVVNLVLDTAVPPSHTIPSQIYLLKGSATAPQRILPQGRLTGDPVGDVLGQIRLLDVAANDTIRAYVAQPHTDSRPAMRYTVTGNSPASSAIIAAENPWDVTLEHHFALENNRVMTLTLALQEGDGRLTTPIAQLCSLDAAIGCHPGWQQNMVNAGGWWQTEFTPLAGQKELPRYAVVRIWDGSDQAVADELVQWLQVAGGVGPTHNDGMAPLLDDVIMVNTSQPYPNAGDCNVVSFMPAANADALAASLPPSFGGLIGPPLDIQITLNQDQCPELVPGQSSPLPVNVLLNFGYSQDEVDRLGLNEQTQLFILHYRPGFNWATWQQIDINTDLNWITSLTTEDGIYAIGWRP